MKDTYRVPFLMILCVLALTAFIKAKDTSVSTAINVLPKTSALDPPQTLANISDWSYWLYRDGESANNPYTGGPGAIFPRGTANVIYTDGVIWGAKVNGDVRVGGQTYRIGTQPLLNYIYRIRKDWATLTHSTVIQDAAEFYHIAINEVSEQQTQDIIEQYKRDWKNWPVSEGAPFVDVNENGMYDPVLDGNGMPDPALGDYPGIHNADQVIWFKVDDQDANKTKNLYGSMPLGIELQVTVWAYDQPAARIGKTIFKKYKIKNISADTFEEMYLSQFSDPDLGNYSDDLAGCIPETNSAFVYNGKSSDEEYSAFNMVPPAVGYTLLQGPIVSSPGDTAYYDSGWLPDYKNLPMTSFAYFASGSSINDPVLGSYDGTLQWYNMQRGYTPTTDLNNPTPYTHGSGSQSGQATKFPLDGDPALGSGDVDAQGSNLPPGDRRIVMTSGPFVLEPGASQEMIVAVVGGYGSDYLNSINELKENIRVAHDLIESGFDSEALKTPEVSYQTKQISETSMQLTITADLTDFDGVNSCSVTFRPQMGGDTPITVSLYDDGLHNDRAAGDNLWGNSLTLVNRKYPHDGDLSLHMVSGDKFYANLWTNVSLRPGPTLENWRFIWENRKQDDAFNNNEQVHLQFDIRNNDAVNDIESLTITRGTSFNFNEGVAAGGLLENNSEFFIVDAPASGDSLTVGYLITYDHYSVFQSKTFPIIPWNENFSPIEVTHEGGAEASVEVTVVDPDSLTGDDYKIYFDQQHYYRDSDGQWKKTKYPDSVGTSLAKSADVSPSVITGAALFSETPGTIEMVFTLDLVSPDNSWVDGVKLIFPPEVTLTSWEPVSGAYGSHVSSGQNVSNSNGTYNAADNSILWGDSSRSKFGGIEGSVYFTVYANSFTPPVTVAYRVYDDGFSGNSVDAVGTITLDEIGYEFKTENVWNLQDITKDKLVLEDQTVMDGVDIYSGEIVGDPIVDGMMITVKGSYDAPKSFSDVLLIKQNGTTSSIADFSVSAQGIGNYYLYGWAEDAKSVNIRGFGSLDPTELGYDYECRWTGVYKSTATVINGINVWEVESGGSMASLYGARLDNLANHPLNPNPGVSEPFLVRIPFEVWNLDTDEQINISIYDRKQKYDGSMDIYAFNPRDRMYTEFVNTPYDPSNVIPEDGGAAADHFTWNLVWWGSNGFATGDTVRVIYSTPLTNNDYFLFTAEATTSIRTGQTVTAFRLLQNYPNPFNPVTTIGYRLPQVSDVELVVYNILGQKVRTLVNKKQAAGAYRIKFDASHLASGLYVYRLKAGAFVSYKKMLLIK